MARRNSNRRLIACGALLLAAIAIALDGRVAAEVNEATSGLFLIHAAAGPPEILEGERGLPELRIELTEDAAAEMERVTRENLGSSAALVIDGEVVTAHKIRAVIEGGRIQLSRCTDTACELIYARLLTR